MFVACTTSAFSARPLELALRQLAELEFARFELALIEQGDQLKPSEVAEDLDAALRRIRYGPGLTPSAFYLDLGEVDASLLRKRFEAMGRLAKLLTVAVITMPAAAAGTPIEAEIERLGPLNQIAHQEGLVLSMLTQSETLTGDPATAVALCKALPGLGITLDPSPYLNGPHAGANYDELFAYVQNVHLRDTGKKPGEFQVRVGQGSIEYGRIVNLLERHGYRRGLTIAYLDALEPDFEVEVETRKLKLLLESLL